LVLNKKMFSSKYYFALLVKRSPKGTAYLNNGCKPIAPNKPISSALKGRYNEVFRPFHLGLTPQVSKVHPFGAGE